MFSFTVFQVVKNNDPHVSSRLTCEFVGGYKSTKVALKVGTHFLINLVLPVTNTNAHVLFFSHSVKMSTLFYHLPHLAALNVANYAFLLKSHFSSLPPSFPTCFFHLSSPPLLWSHAPYFLPAIPAAIFFSLSAPHPFFSCPPACTPLFFSLSLAGWLIHFYRLLSAGVPPEEHPCCGQAMCRRTCCRGEPNAAASHTKPFQAGVLFVFTVGFSYLIILYNIEEQLYFCCDNVTWL